MVFNLCTKIDSFTGNFERVFKLLLWEFTVVAFINEKFKKIHTYITILLLEPEHPKPYMRLEAISSNFK